MNRTIKIPAFHSSVGIIALMPRAGNNVRIEIALGDRTEALSEFRTKTEAQDAIKMQRTGFTPWDSLAQEIAQAEYADSGRWKEATIRMGINE